MTPLYYCALTLIALGGLLYRAGGSSWFNNDSAIHGLRIAKLACRALPLGGAALLLGVSPWLALAVWVLSAAADSLPHGQWQGASSAGQTAIMSLVTLATVLPVGGVLLYSGDVLHATAAIIAAALCGPATWLGNKIPCHFRIGPIGFDQGPEMGEVARGAVRLLFVLA